MRIKLLKKPCLRCGLSFLYYCHKLVKFNLISITYEVIMHILPLLVIFN
ncbi:hypothetical protein BAZSYMB_SCAFFOLD00013_9 [Bathymodiolus azoricus thioautotrophic gill symbiont]|uniref:Uncharacterized protein n=1 Tax=Bathymodiolus azoricus thioautotrophic gill symbiont TaxID=235205 RepID=A0A1H6L290_9GAMM|nr:hypothetical protein BAZSYMB_SCAFFOLD00013_9 [Bathymodiolus azoricus thioautotrophic gill symbiont]